MSNNYICFIRSNDMNPDPRVNKYINYLNEINYRYITVGWNRYLSNRVITDYSFNKKAKYGSGYKNVINLIQWNLFIFIVLYKERYNIKTIHSCDFDTIIPSYIFSKLFKKKVIFDIFDLYEDSRNFNNRFIKKIISILEQYFIKKSDIVIICEEERKIQIKGNVKNLIIIPNIPYISNSLLNILNKSKMDIENIVYTENIKIGYLGVLTDDRCIKELLDVIDKNAKFELDIAGFGPLEDICKQMMIKNNRIRYYGKVNYEDGLKMLLQSDYMWAYYSPINNNNKLAAPNKFYESLMLGVPIITSSNTLVGEKVKKYNTGIVINKDDISMLPRFLKKDIKIYKKNCKYYWENYFKEYLKNNISLIYKGKM